MKVDDVDHGAGSGVEGVDGVARGGDEVLARPDFRSRMASTDQGQALIYLKNRKRKLPSQPK
jgi:hypothetical protein